MKKTPRKAAQERKTLIIKIRVNVGQLNVLQAAADRASLDLSTWIRTVTLKAAKEGLSMPDEISPECRLKIPHPSFV
jgi:uncharacterized protein (DUF1778 family)